MLQTDQDKITGISWLPDGESFICSVFKGSFCHWTRTGKLLHITDKFPQPQHSCLSPDGSQFIFVDSDHQLQIYGLQDYTAVGCIPLEGKAQSVMLELGTNLALLDVSTTSDNDLQLIDLTDGSIVQRFRSARLTGEFMTKSTFFCRIKLPGPRKQRERQHLCLGSI